MNTLPRILFADDNPHDVEMTLATFEDHHIANDVIVVSDGAEALDFLFARGRFAGRTDGNPLFVLLDLKMPRVDGLDVLKAIKQADHLRTIPVVMLTSSREEQDLIRSYQLGVNAYIVKPVGVPAFLEAVRQIGVFWTMHNALPRPSAPKSPDQPPLPS